MFKKELRLVVTESCNYNCVFCHKEGMKKYEKTMLNADDYAFLFKICKDEFNWDEVTITGGEPFVRKDIDDIINKIYQCDGKITVVTNGELINKHVECLKFIDRINISIHTLNYKKYDEIVQRKNKLKEVLRNISTIKNFYPEVNFRLNSVIIRNENDSLEELKEYIEFAKRIKASIKFVELFSDNKEEIVKIEEIAEKLKQLGFKYNNLCNIDKLQLTDGETLIVLSRIFCANAVSQIDPEKFCNKYNDLFITPEGNINICRNSKEDICIYKEIKERNSIKLIEKIKYALNNIGKNCKLCKDEKKLAINGGTPIFKTKDEGKFIHPKITPNIEKAVINQLHDSISIYDNKGIIDEFENNFSNYIGTKYALTFSSGTAALWGMYEGISLKEGDEVICPCYTFFATVTPILFTGAKPIFVDCSKDGNIDVEKVKEKITPKTKAIVVTHMWGYPCKIDELRTIADENGIYLLEDCSHAHGAMYKDRMLGAWGDAAVFSLQGQKIISGGEGGILVTNNIKIKEKALLLGHYNKRCKNEISKSSELYKYSLTGKGMKLRAHPLALRIANEYLKELNNINNKKNEYAKLIIKELDGIEGLKVLKPNEFSKNSWYAILFKYDKEKMKGISRERFVEALHKEGAVEVDIPNSTCPLNNLEIFKEPNALFVNNKFKLDNNKENFTNSQEFYNNIVKLPVWYTDDEKDIVLKYIKAIKKVCNNIDELL